MFEMGESSKNPLDLQGAIHFELHYIILSPDFTSPQISPRFRFNLAPDYQSVQVQHHPRVEDFPDRHPVQIQRPTRWKRAQIHPPPRK